MAFWFLFFGSFRYVTNLSDRDGANVRVGHDWVFINRFYAVETCNIVLQLEFQQQAMRLMTL